MLSLDTPIVVFALQGALSRREHQLLIENDCSVSGIVLWELSKLHQLGRIDIDPASGELAEFLSHLTILPLNLETAVLSTQLDFRSDPADEIIAATSLVYQAPLVTRDVTILKSKTVLLA